MKLEYKNQNGEVLREGQLKQAYSPEDINVFFAFGNELDVTNKHVHVIHNVTNPEKIYTLRKGTKVKTLMECGLTRQTAKKYKDQKYFSRKTTRFKEWKKISHLLEPLAVEKYVGLEDGRIVKYRDYEGHLKGNYHRFLAKPGLTEKLGTSQNKLAIKVGMSLAMISQICRQERFFTTADPLYLYLLKKNMMDMAIYLDEVLYKKFLVYRKSLDNKKEK